MDEYYDYAIRLSKIDRKLNYIEKRMFGMVKDEVKLALSEAGFRKFLFNVAGNFVKDNIKTILDTIIKEVFSKQTALFREQNRRISDLSLSIDEDIKKIIREIDCSSITNDIIKERIDTIFNNLQNKGVKRLEDKDGNK